MARTSACGQRVGEEVTGMEAQPVGEPEAGDVVLEERADRGQVEAAARDVLVRAGDCHRQTALGGADVDERLVLVPGELGGDRT